MTVVISAARSATSAAPTQAPEKSRQVTRKPYPNYKVIVLMMISTPFSTSMTAW